MATSKAIFPGLFLLLLSFAAHAQNPVIADGGVLNGASFDKTGQPVAPGSLVSIFGSDLAAASESALSVPLSTQLSSVKVTFNGIEAPLKDVVHQQGGSDQINAQVPWEVLPLVPPGTAATAEVQVIVSRNGVTSAPLTVKVGAAAPGIFTFPGGLGQAVAYGNLDYAIAAPTNSGLPFTSHPAKVNDLNTLVILATGLGPVDNPPKSGDIPKTLANTLTKPVVLVGGVPAQVVFSGLSQYVGVYQINIIIDPKTPTGDKVPLQIQMNGITSRDDVTIAVTN